MFTVAEKERRHKAINQMIIRENLNALLLYEHSQITAEVLGDLRYYTNNRLVGAEQVAIAFPDAEPVLFAWSEVQRQAAARQQFVKDCRMSTNLLVDVVKLLKERGISAGRIGINLGVLPAAWYEYLKQEFPQIQWIETHKQILQIRLQKSQEEAEVFRKCAALCDGCYEVLKKAVRPGVTQFEIVAEVEHFSRAGGAEEHFTLIGSGKFPITEGNRLPLSYPQQRKVEVGDIVIMEITPRYEGYWAQLVRIVNVGKPNTVMEKLHKVCVETIKKGLDELKPGKKVRDVMSAMETFVSKSGTGYLLKPPFGHVVGVQLLEGRVSMDNEMVLTPGTAVIIHPGLFLPDGKNMVFWGETYLVTQDGYERLNRAPDDLVTV